MAAEAAYVEVTLAAKKAGDQYEALCLELGTASCGDTLEEALENIKDAVAVHLKELEQTGQLSRVLTDLGLSPTKRRPGGKLVTIGQVPKDAVATKFQVRVSTSLAA